MLKESSRYENSTVFEGMTSIRAVIKGADSNISDRKIIEIIYDRSREKKLCKELNFLRKRGAEDGFEVIAVNGDEIERKAIGTSHGGIIALCTERTIPELKLRQNDIPDRGFYVMIQGIEDPYNFGYALRSLYVCGVDGILLPERNWMSAAGVVSRSSAGASELFNMYRSEAVECARIFKSKGYMTVSAEENSENALHKTSLPLPILLIVGGEKRGISASLRAVTDISVKIEYSREFRASLSAASAATILGYEIFRQNFSLLSK